MRGVPEPIKTLLDVVDMQCSPLHPQALRTSALAML